MAKCHTRHRNEVRGKPPSPPLPLITQHETWLPFAVLLHAWATQLWVFFFFLPKRQLYCYRQKFNLISLKGRDNRMGSWPWRLSDQNNKRLSASLAPTSMQMTKSQRKLPWKSHLSLLFSAEVAKLPIWWNVRTEIGRNIKLTFVFTVVLPYVHNIEDCHRDCQFHHEAAKESTTIIFRGVNLYSTARRNN